MKQPPANINSFWAAMMVEELIRNGCNYFCLAPGSRCTPLTVAVADHPEAVTTIHYDERGLAFHALGYARASGKPAVVITTSGTAVANLMPAVVEASMERIPMLLLTADRPPELRDCGANQTIDQIKIFGTYARWFVDLACPETSISPRMVLSTIDQAAYRCCWPEAGPVHLNCMFREPLAPEPESHPTRSHRMDEYVAATDKWFDSKSPLTEYIPPNRTMRRSVLQKLTDVIMGTQRGLVILGGLQSEAERRAVSACLEVLRWPVCADATSSFRMGDNTGTAVGYYDILLRDNNFARTYRPETILHIGGRFVSKQLAQFLTQTHPAHYILVTNHAHRQDPGHEITLRIETDITSLCRELAAALTSPENRSWLAAWQDKGEEARQVMVKFIASEEKLSEPAVAFLLSRHIPADHGLFLGSSMPVRDMDLFADPRGNAVPVGANRGASGIDGTIASACGFAMGLRKTVTLLMGDLAFLHDINSLAFLHQGKYPVIIVVINNNGGGIFSLLPIARFERYLEPYFVTPHGLSFEHVARMFGLSYFLPGNCRDFVEAYHEAAGSGKSAIVEVPIDRTQNLGVHHQLIDRMQKALMV
jgi:2-succinyl-5-enolpyruvyl-6-hydroxy-3-cyclohexene-1-carboxylate synthase